ncbi:MAG: hypothetical protein ABIJ36_03730 [Patescibacteria group bacterium]
MKKERSLLWNLFWLGTMLATGAFLIWIAWFVIFPTDGKSFVVSLIVWISAVALFLIGIGIYGLWGLFRKKLL